jgi:flagellar hook protein FlgE
MGILNVFSTSSQGMNVQATALQNISGNIANSTTPGFKKVDTAFADLLQDTGVINQLAGSVGSTSRLSTEVSGTIAATDKPTNMALAGSGFFVVAKNTGSATSPTFTDQDLYTRRGDFMQDVNGNLTNGAGYSLVGAASAGGAATTPIKISTAPLASGATLTGVSVTTTGAVTGEYSDGQSAVLGQVAIAQFNGNNKLEGLDGGAYAATDESGAAFYGTTSTTIVGGSVEGSNADIADQFTKMIATQQAYQSNSKVLTSANEMLEDAINILR